MSHKTQVKTKLDNLEYIKRGLDDLGIKYKVADEGQKLTTKGNYSVHEPVDILVTEVDGKNINEAFGFNKNEDGTYTCVGDFYMTGMTENKLRNITTVAAKKIEANDRMMQLGFQLSETVDEKGEVELTYTRWV